MEEEWGTVRRSKHFFWRGPICWRSGWSLAMERQCVKRHMWHRRTIGLWSSSRYPCFWTVGLSSGSEDLGPAKLQCGPGPSSLVWGGKAGVKGVPRRVARYQDLHIHQRSEQHSLSFTFLSSFSSLSSCIRSLKHAEMSYFTVSLNYASTGFNFIFSICKYYITLHYSYFELYLIVIILQHII